MGKTSHHPVTGLNRASRHAGLRLMIMLALLLVPVGTMLYFFASSAMKDIRLGERQTVGAAYLKKITAVYVDVLQDQVPDKANVTALNFVPDAISARRPNVLEDVETLADRFAQGLGNDPVQLWHLRNLTLDVATTADLALGQYRDQQLLASALSTHLPELANQVKVASMGKKTEATQTEFAVLRSAAFQALSEAVKEDRSGDAALALNQALSDFDDAAEQFDNALPTQDMTNLRAPITTMISRINELSVQSQAVLAGKIEARTRSLKWQLALVLASIAVASIFALAVAAHLMKATFRELDTVEAARETLEASEAQAIAFAEDLQKLNGEIAVLNTELTQNFKVLQETQDDNIAKSKMAQLGALTAMVAHELRNPLGAVRTSSFTIDRMSSKAGFDFSKQTSRIAHAVERCDTTISQLLHYASSNEISVEDTDLAEWLEQLLRDGASSLPDWITLELVDEVGNPRCSIDKKKLGHAVSSLLANAAQAYATTHKEGDTGECRIEIRIDSSNDHIELSVSDMGPGIPADNLPLVKEPLFTTKNFGPGLGLAIADQVIKQHAGSLTIVSEVGKGTKVTLRLPVFTAECRVA